MEKTGSRISLISRAEKFLKNGFMKKLADLAGFVLSLFAGFSYAFVFTRWPITREFPWANLILVAIALVLLFLGVRRAPPIEYCQPIMCLTERHTQICPGEFK